MTTPLQDAQGGWPEVLLDGIVGSLIGALATILVVVLTIRHERRERVSSALDTAILSAQAAAQTHSMTVRIRGFQDPSALASHEAMLKAMTTAIALAQRSEPELAELLRDAALDLSSVTAKLDGTPAVIDEYHASSLRLTTAVGQWLARPDLIRRKALGYERVRHMVATANENGIVEKLDMGRPVGRFTAWWRPWRS